MRQPDEEVTSPEFEIHPPSPFTDSVHEAIVFHPSAESAGRARRVVRRACVAAGVDADACDTAVLLTSEVVTNAFTHGRSEARLRIEATAERVHVEVGDDNSRHPQLQPADDGALDGRGLFIVDLLATRWGVRDDAIGKVVWFELVDPPAASTQGVEAEERPGGVAEVRRD